jgi:uncharacterized protein (DUF58 family)
VVGVVSQKEIEMALRHYFPISVGVFVLVILAARYVSIPILPFALVLLVGETLIGLQLEDRKISRFLEDLRRAWKSGAR